jgi:ATP-dependent Lon protease
LEGILPIESKVEVAQPVEAAASHLSLYKTELPERVLKTYQINTRNIEKFLDVPHTDDNYYHNINKQLPIGSSNGLAYVDDGYGTVLKIQFVKKSYGLAPPKQRS